VTSERIFNQLTNLCRQNQNKLKMSDQNSSIQQPSSLQMIPGELAANLNNKVKTFVLKDKGFLVKDMLRDKILE